ncbi:hypothetical protein [Eleftheria terrae]|uniref:hypothetical protein n=1 Tax=Eleftheria terrae TaxID=1597781 RepID=UPI00263B34A9|nr:hypothetical protein [Eleftheria terrae]WKB52291.1 hypothetical protein N7L95_21245 [Eleftheria terrae]
MSWVYTLAGHEVELRDPRPSQVVISDIAHHLSLINRFNGATTRPYSVAEHLLLVSEIGERELRLSVHGQLAALLHAAHLTWLGDIAEPVRAELGDAWRVIESRFAAQVRACFGVAAASAAHRAVIEQADRMAIATARRDLLPVGARPWPGHENVNAVTWANLADAGRARFEPSDWRQAFMDRYAELDFARNEATARWLGRKGSH